MLSEASETASTAARVTFKLFRDAWGFCHNPTRHAVEVCGLRFPTAEHAYQAAKALDWEVRRAVAACPSPWSVMETCRDPAFPLRSDWEASLSISRYPIVSRVKEAAMLLVVASKFAQHPSLAAKLAALPIGAVLVEDASGHGDAWWGETAPGVGRNALGQICTLVARAIQADRLVAVTADADLQRAWRGDS